MQVKTVTGGIMPTNCYFLTDSKSGYTAVIDPGFFDDSILQELQNHKNKVQMILLTHGHFDHIMGVSEVQKVTGAPVWMYKSEKEFAENAELNLSAYFSQKITPFVPEHLLYDDEEFLLGELSIHVIHTPGHTRGGCTFCTDGALFTGDTLMTGSAGRTDFVTGNSLEMMSSLQKLNNLEGNYNVFPGHGTATTLNFERKTNPFLREYNI